MPITNLNSAIAQTMGSYDWFKATLTPEAAGILVTPFYTAGRPNAAAANGLAIAGSALANTGSATIAGSFPVIQPSTTDGRIYITRFTVCGNIGFSAILADRLWHNDSIAETTTTPQLMTTPTWPPRDLLNSTCGSGVMVGIEVSTATTNAGAVVNTTLTYTNDRGVNSRTATISSFPATAVAGTIVPFELQSGDTGVQSIQSVTLGTSYGGGTIHLVAYRPITQVFMQSNTQIGVGDILTGGFPNVASGAVLFPILMPIATTALTISGQLSYAVG
jgi:hypothetical protein